MDVVKLVEKHRRLLSDWDRKQHANRSKCQPGSDIEKGIDVIPWPWTLLNLIHLLAQYPSGLSEAVLCSELEVLWDEVQSEFDTENKPRAVASFATQIMSRSRGAIILLDDDLRYELKILSVEKLPGSTIDILVVADIEAGGAANLKYRIEYILHSKFLPLLSRGVFSGHRFHKQYSVSLKLAGSLHVEIGKGNLFRLLPTINVVFNLHCGREQFLAILGRDPVVPLVDLPGHIKQSPGVMPQIGLWRLHRAVKVRDVSVKDQISVVFPHSQASLVGSLEVGGYLGLYCPHVSYSGIKVVLRVDPTTLLFYTEPEGLDVSLALAKTTDQTFRLPRLTLGQMVPDLNKITLLVRVVTFTRNVPMEDCQGNKFRRCTLVVEDLTGVSYVTFWEQAVSDIAESCIPGHLLLLHHLHTTATPDTAPPGSVYINAHPAERFRFNNITTLKGVLNTSSVASKLPLTDIDHWFASDKTKAACFVGECTVTGCTPVVIPNAVQDKGSFTVQTHRSCRQPVREYHASQLKDELRSKVLGDYLPGSNEIVYYCEHCSICISQFDSQAEVDRCFSLAWALDDGTRQIICYGFWKASLDLLKVSPNELLLLEGLGDAHPTPPAFPHHLLQGSSIRTPPAFQTPHAAKSILGHKFRVGISKLPDYFQLNDAMSPAFPFPKELGFEYSLNMAH